MSDPEMVIFLDHLPEDAWIKLNPGQIGFYRTCYSHEMIQSLIPAIPSLSSVDRLGLENDLFALAVAGVSKTTDFLDLLTGYRNEDNYSVWSDIDNNISSLSIILQNTDFFDEFKSFVVKLYKPVFKKLGWEIPTSEDHQVTMLKSLIINRLGLCGDPDVISEAQHQFNNHVSGENPINPNLRLAVYRIVAANGNEDTTERLISLFHNATLNEEKCRILKCLGYSSDAVAVTNALLFALSKDVRSQDCIHVVSGCTRSLCGREAAWYFLKENWDELFERYSGSTLLARFIKITASSFVKQAEEDDVRLFFAKHPTPSGERTVKQALENINLNRTWLERDGQHIHEWLEKQKI